MDNYTIRDRIRGSLIGGAIGDALGYPVEFIYSFGEIQRRYGRNGITRLDTHQWWLEEDNGNGKAVVSDDTQMTLFTACGLLNAKAENDPFLPSICEAYIEWLFTQMGKKKKGYDKCWIRNVPELNVRRAPGHTCITSLNDIFRGDDPINNSKGCGGVMRIAPIPLYGATADRMDIKDVCKLAADASELTHQHPLGYIPSALVAYVIYKLAQDEAPERETCKDYIREGLKVIAELFPNYPEEVKRFTTLIKTAILWSDISTDDVRTIEEELGGGWVAEETVAIAVYCSLAYFDNFERAMIASVNHKGDSDSTGAVTGNILGAALGYEAIPQYFKDDLELHDVILHVADDLWRDKTTEFLNNNRNYIAMKYNKQNLIDTARSFARDDFVFFWGHTDRMGGVGKVCLSQWYMCSFAVEDVYYNCAEQYMMAEKARIFGDDDAWQQIMASHDPMTIKKLGRKIRNFNAYVWEMNCQEVVQRGNLAKFSQNPKLMEYLLGTGDKILVEASPKDTIWGIGLPEDAPEVCNLRLWQGENLLGFTLMEVRDMLRVKEEDSADNVSEEDMKKALLMWTMGAGNSARRFNYEDPMPEKTKVAKPWGNPLDRYVSMPQDFYLTARQMDIIRYGHIPDAMEDHWYMYCDDNAIHYLRSWTGFHIFEAHYEENGDEYRITELRVNNNPDECRLSDAESATALFYALLISEYGGDASAYWYAALG